MTDPIFSGHPSFHPRLWKFPSPDALREALEFWTEHMGLGDWVIDVERVPGLKIPGSYARVRNTAHSRRATIQLTSADDHVDCDPMDEEQTLVHELLHVMFSGWDHHLEEADFEKLEYKLCVERHIDRLAYLLVNLRRGGRHLDPLVTGPHTFTFEQPERLEKLKESIMSELGRVKSETAPGAATCAHANECPALCPCQPDCYCQWPGNTCGPSLNA